MKSFFYVIIIIGIYIILSLPKNKISKYKTSKYKRTSQEYSSIRNDRKVNSINVNREERIKKAGERGEKDVAYELEWLNKEKYIVYNGIRLRNKEKPQEFDHLVIGENGIFNLETKNYKGDIKIDNQGNWIRIINGREEGAANPSGQVDRHRKVLESILGKDCPIIDVIVLANKNTIITGTEKSRIPIIKVDAIRGFIEGYNRNNVKLSISNINKSNELIKEHIIQDDDQQYDNKLKEQTDEFGFVRIVV